MSEQLPEGNAVIGQSGGPTAVINQSLVGAVEALRGAGAIDRVYGARHAVRGMLKEDFVDMGRYSQDDLERIAITPSAALGSSRDKPDREYGEKIVEVFKKHNIRYFFYIGGNDSSDTCRIVKDVARESNYDLRSFHIPKTIDNDLLENDHTPGYGSAAKFVAMAFMGDALDNASLPGIKVNVVMGRHAGFLTGASALARRRDDDGPHLIYLPETDFDPDRFVGDVEHVYSRLGRCQIAVSEGINDKAGNFISAMMSGFDETDQHGNVQLSGTGALGDWLAHMLRSRLTPAGGKPPRIRADTFGYLQRCWPDASAVDQQEARKAGAMAAMYALQGRREGSVAIQRVSTIPYKIEMPLVELEKIAGKTRRMPAEYIDGRHDVSQSFLDYLRPLVGTLPVMGRL